MFKNQKQGVAFYMGRERKGRHPIRLEADPLLGPRDLTRDGLTCAAAYGCQPCSLFHIWSQGPGAGQESGRRQCLGCSRPSSEHSSLQGDGMRSMGLPRPLTCCSNARQGSPCLPPNTAGQLPSPSLSFSFLLGDSTIPPTT